MNPCKPMPWLNAQDMPTTPNRNQKPPNSNTDKFETTPPNKTNKHEVIVTCSLSDLRTSESACVCVCFGVGVLVRGPCANVGMPRFKKHNKLTLSTKPSSSPESRFSRTTVTCKIVQSHEVWIPKSDLHPEIANMPTCFRLRQVLGSTQCPQQRKQRCTEEQCLEPAKQKQ